MPSFHHILPPLFGYHAPSTAGINADEPLMEIGSATAGEVTLLKEDTFFPKQIQLRTFVKAIPLPALPAQVTLITQGDTLASRSLYQGPSGEPPDLFAHGRFQAVKLEYQGGGRYQQGQETLRLQGYEADNFRILLAEENNVYTKPFAWETRAAVVERVTQLADGRVFINPPGGVNERVLRPFGGFFRAGMLATQCQQVYYELSEKNGATSVLLTVDPPANAVFLPSPAPAQALSLSAALSAGHASLTVYAGEEKRIYSSVAAEHPGDNPPFLDVTFVPHH